MSAPPSTRANNRRTSCPDGVRTVRPDNRTDNNPLEGLSVRRQMSAPHIPESCSMTAELQGFVDRVIVPVLLERFLRERVDCNDGQGPVPSPRDLAPARPTA